MTETDRENKSTEEKISGCKTDEKIREKDEYQLKIMLKYK